MPPFRPSPRRSLWRWPVRLALGLGALFLAASFWVEVRYLHRIRSRALAPSAPVALVFGAGLAGPGVPSPVLAGRLDAAVALYRDGRVGRLLLSGDSARYHDETGAMRRYALARGVPEAALVVDRAGLSTYDSVLRAQQVFGVQRVILVTQRFHLSRALYIANALGMDAWGVSAGGGTVPADYTLRELVSRPVALASVWARWPHAPDRPELAPRRGPSAQRR